MEDYSVSVLNLNNCDSSKLPNDLDKYTNL